MIYQNINKQFGSIENEKVETMFVTKEKYTFTWVIKNFRSYSCQVGEYSESPHFTCNSKEEYDWTLDIFAAGCDKKSRDYIGIRAYLDDASVDIYTNFTVKCSILDKNGKKHFASLVEVDGTQGEIPHFIRKNDLLNQVELLLPNDELRIACEIFESSVLGKEVELQPSQNKQMEVFKNLFDTKKFSDFKLLVKGKEFLVHRAILGTQSPVFEAMFESNMRETAEGKVQIDDIEPEVMEKLLQFVYVEELDFGKLVDKVLVAADKYQLESLKLLCEKELAKGLNVENIYDILLLADRNNATYLKEKSIEFFDINLKILVAADNFKVSVNSLPPDVRTDIIAAYALKR